MAEQAQIVCVRVDLEGDLAKKFNELKDKKGVKNNSELFRILVNEAYERDGGG